MSRLSKAKYDFTEAAALVNQSQRIMLVGHVSPDGDTVGSCLALAWGLKALNKQPYVVFADDIPENLKFMPGSNEIIKPAQCPEQVDLIILVDCATLARTGDGWLKPYLETTPLLIIDHHALRDEIGTVQIIDPDAAATGELIYHFLTAMQIELTPQMANCMYAAISSDTGGFRFANTTEDAFLVASKLISIDVDTEAMRINLFESRTMKSMAMVGKALLNLKQSQDKKLVWTFIDRQAKEEYQAGSVDCDNISGFTMYPIGVRVGIFFEELPETGTVKLSMRCRRGYHVGGLAARFGGGGHVLASGCKIKGSLQQVMDQVLPEARKMIAECEAGAVEA